MTLQQYTVSYSTDNGSTYTDLTNVVSININIGRQAQLDQIKTLTGSVVMRYPTGYASPITGLVAGTFIAIRNTTPTQTENYLISGSINDVAVEYGIPYVSNQGQGDYLTITFEGTFAQFGRMQGQNYALASDTMSQQVVAAQTQTGLYISFSGGGSNPVMAATTISGTWGDWVAKACQTLNARIRESFFLTQILSPFSNVISAVNFSDTANNATNQVYNKINFGSLADNFYTQVTVSPESFGSATVTNAGAVAPYRTYQTNTFNASTAQATDYANYLLGNYGTSKFAILSLTCSGESQTSFALDIVGAGPGLYNAPGAQVSVAFRGTTYQCIIEGVTMSATPGGSSYTYYFSGADLNNTLILDNTVFGTLDYNRLGY